MIRRRPTRFLIPISLMLLAGCVQPQTMRPEIDAQMMALEAQKQREIAFRLTFDTEMRLNRVASRVLAGAAPLCGTKIRPMIGLWVANSQLYPSPNRAAATKVLGLSRQVKAVYVAPETPAAKAGLKAGDVILAIDGQPTSEGQGAVPKFIKQLKELHGDIGSPIAFNVRRDGMEQRVEMRAVPACDYPVVVKTDDVINAYADGKAIYVTKGMMRFVRTDEELALVVGHELGHDVMGHIAAKQANAAGGQIAGALIDILFAVGGVNTQGSFSQLGGDVGAAAFSQDFESEADYVGLYFLARAGYQIDDAPNFWRRMAAENPGSIEMAKTHPPTAQRYVALEKEVAEIHDKQAAGRPLEPEMKPKAAMQPAEDPDVLKAGPQ